MMTYAIVDSNLRANALRGPEQWQGVAASHTAGPILATGHQIHKTSGHARSAQIQP